MNQEKKIIRSILILIFLTVIISLIQYTYYESKYFYPGGWILAYIFTYATVILTMIILRLKRLSDPFSLFQGRLYHLVLIASFMWAIGIHLLGINQFFILDYELLTIFGVHFGITGLPLFGMSWWWLMKKFKDPFLFLSRYISLIQLLLLFMISNTWILMDKKEILLLIFVIKYPFRNFQAILYMFLGIILIGIILTKIGRTRYGAILTLILVFTEIFLHWLMLLKYSDYISTSGWWLFLPSFYLNFHVGIPISYWVEHFSKS